MKTVKPTHFSFSPYPIPPFFLLLKKVNLITVVIVVVNSSYFLPNPNDEDTTNDSNRKYLLVSRPATQWVQSADCAWLSPGSGTGDVPQHTAVGRHEVQHLAEHPLQTLAAGAQKRL